MKLRAAIPGVLITLGLVTAEPSRAARPGTVTLRGSLGFAASSLNSINTEIENTRSAFLADTLLEEATWSSIGGAPNLALELDAQVSPLVSVGIGFSAQRGSQFNEAFKTFSFDEFGEPAEFESFAEQPRFSAWDIVGTVGLWVPSAPGFHFGGQLGLVRGTFSNETAHIFSTFSGEFTEMASGSWSGTGLSAGVFTGYEQSLGSTLSFSTRVGYRYRKVEHPEGVKRILLLDENEGTQLEWEQGPLLDAAGNPMALDLGGYYFNVVLSVGLGGGE